LSETSSFSPKFCPFLAIMTPPPERDIDPITGAELDLLGTKKRSSEDASEYPRRRATIAVGFL
jgi:hypothetical protein